MKSSAPAEPHSHRLKFHWPQRPQLSLALVGFLFLSLFAHALAFYLFQVVYPPVVAISSPPAQVSLLTPSNPENQALLQWIDSEDPAAIANPHEIVPGNLYDIAYQSSFADVRTGPKLPDETAAPVPFPSAQGTMQIISSTEKNATRPATNFALRETEVKFSGNLAGRKITNMPASKPGAQDTGTREPVSFLVGVGPDGKVQYTFLMGVETDDSTKALDAQAENYLNRVEFAAAPGSTAWGVATFYWGEAGPQSPTQP